MAVGNQESNIRFVILLSVCCNCIIQIYLVVKDCNFIRHFNSVRQMIRREVVIFSSSTFVLYITASLGKLKVRNLLYKNVLLNLYFWSFCKLEEDFEECQEKKLFDSVRRGLFSSALKERDSRIR